MGRDASGHERETMIAACCMGQTTQQNKILSVQRSRCSGPHFVKPTGNSCSVGFCFPPRTRIRAVAGSAAFGCGHAVAPVHMPTVAQLPGPATCPHVACQLLQFILHYPQLAHVGGQACQGFPSFRDTYLASSAPCKRAK